MDVMNQLELTKISKQSFCHLWKAGQLVKSISPELSRFYIHQMQELSERTQIIHNFGQQFCNYCGSLWWPKDSSFRVKLMPRPLLSKRLRRLYSFYLTKPRQLSKRSRKLITKIKEECNKMVFHCNVCGRKTKYNGDKKPHLPQKCAVQQSHLTPRGTKSVLSPQSSTNSKRNQKKRLLLHKVLENERKKTPSPATKSNLKMFLRSV